MTKVLIIVDKFKGSLTAREVASVISCALKEKAPHVHVSLMPLADGGDGTIDSIEHFADQVIHVETLDPVGDKTEVPVLRIGGKILCEMAKSTGLWHLPKEKRNPRKTSSYGFGLVIKKLAERGFRDFLLCIGGSATNDVGTGMLSALGYKFRDDSGKQVSSQGNPDSVNLPEVNLPEGFVTGEDLINISSFDAGSLPDYIKELNIEVACDVNNPLTGVYGATRVYGPQKGASHDDVEYLEMGVVNFARLSQDYFGRDNSALPGAGAAGGMGFALSSFLNAKLCSGWKILFDFLEVEEKIAGSDIIITGEGRVDGQSLSGKLLDGVLEIAIKHKKRVWVLCGDNLLTDREIERAGIEYLFSISQMEPSKDKAIEDAKNFLTNITYKAATFL